MTDTVEIVFKYFQDLTDHQKQQFYEVGKLYQDWNAKINVISRKDISNLYERHILHSLAIAKVVDFKEGTSILDVGTGGGFPGIPLAILFPECRFHLIDSVGKKIKVVQSIGYHLNLKNVSCEQVRAENVPGDYDFIVSRAVTRLKPFYEWVKNTFSSRSFNDMPNGILYLKGGDIEQELGELKRSFTEFDLKDYFEEEFFESKKVVYIPYQ